MIFIQMSYMLTKKIWSKKIASGLIVISLMNSLIHMMQITSIYRQKVKAVEGNINLNTLSRFEYFVDLSYYGWILHQCLMTFCEACIMFEKFLFFNLYNYWLEILQTVYWMFYKFDSPLSGFNRKSDGLGEIFDFSYIYPRTSLGE